MAGYLGASPVPQTIQKKQSFTATASQTTFTTTGYTDGAFINVYLNGVRLINGTDYTATNGSDIVLGSAAAASDVLDFETFNEFQLTDQEFADSVIIENNTSEDSDGGRAGKLVYKGKQSGGEQSTLAEIQASHDGTADDQKGDLIFRTNDGNDGTSPTERLKIDSTGAVGVSGSTKTTALSSAAHFDTLGLTVDDNTAYNNVGVGGGIAFRGKRNSSGTQTVFGAIDVGKESAANDSYTGSLRFYTNNNSTGIPTKHMNIDALGRITKPNQPAFQVNKNNTNQDNFAINTDVQVTWPNERFDVGDNFASNQFTAPVTGKYQFNVMVRFDQIDIDASYILLWIQTSNQIYRWIVNPKFTADPAYYTASVAVLADMDAGDVCFVQVNQGGGAAQTDISGDTVYTWFTGHLVC